MNATPQSRRRLLKSLLALATTLSNPGPARAVTTALAGSRAEAHALLEAIGVSMVTAQKLLAPNGRPRAVADATLDGILSGLALDIGLPVSTLADTHVTELRSRVDALVRRDFRLGRTALVDGWILAQSELLIHALAALLAEENQFT